MKLKLVSNYLFHSLKTSKFGMPVFKFKIWRTIYYVGNNVDGINNVGNNVDGINFMGNNVDWINYVGNNVDRINYVGNNVDRN